MQKLHTVRFLQKYGIKINAILDTYQQGNYLGIPIILFSDFLRSSPDSESWFVISSPSVEEEIRRPLEQYFPKENIFAFETTSYVEWIPDVEEYRAYLTEHWDELSQLHNALADEKSKETLVNIIKGRITGNLDYFRCAYDPEKYYPEAFIHLSKEVWVEVGSYRGETLLEFLERCPDYQMAYCFEPDPNNLTALYEVVSQIQGNERIQIIPKGAWDRSTTLRFSDSGGATNLSHVIDENHADGSCVQTVAIDDTIREPITYLKISTSSPELKVLTGGKRQIAENRPKISVCVSYGAGEMLDIWNYLCRLVPDYHFYLRHHLKDGGIESFLYAV